jgi:hypothetical protein
VGQNQLPNAASSIDSGTTTLGDWWAPAISYEYVVGTATLRSDRIRFYLPLSRDRSVAEAIRARYVVGKSVPVAYDPDHPDHAVLEPGFRQGVWKPTLAALLFWSAALILFYDITHPGVLSARFRAASAKEQCREGEVNDQSEEVA